MKALGMIEVYGLLTAVEALDAALKAANVQLVSVTKVTGGLVCVQITGDVGATKAAIDASATAAAKVGKVISVHVIPRPAQSIEAMLSPRSPGLSGSGDAGVSIIDDRGVTDDNSASEPDAANGLDQGSDSSMAADAVSVQSALPLGNDEGPTEPSRPERIDDLTALTVVELRAMARDIGVSSMSKRDIRFAKKGELLTAIRNFREQGR